MRAMHVLSPLVSPEVPRGGRLGLRSIGSASFYNKVR
jgi:hypothetical protein